MRPLGNSDSRGAIKEERKMCDLCGENSQIGRERAQALSEKLEKMAQYKRMLARGYLKPHTEDTKPIAPLAKSIIRELVEDYV